jgi:hypothetical protein
MDPLVSLEMDLRFRDFNLCAYWGPTLSPPGFPEARLCQSAYLIRKGDAADLAEFADALTRTIRPETFRAFQKIHGPRPITYSDWYCSKLQQFFGILLYQQLLVVGLGPRGAPGPPQTGRPWEEGILYCEHALIQKDAIERAFSPAEVNRVDWLAATERLVAAGPRGREILETWLAQRGARRKQEPSELRSKSPGRPMRKTQLAGKRREPRRERDGIIRMYLGMGLPPQEICQKLDRFSIAVTRAIQKRGLTSWSDGWEDPEVRRNIQTLFSKAKAPEPD